MMISDRPEATASSTTYWIIGLSTSGSISLGCALVAGRKRVPRPAAGKTALRTFMTSLYVAALAPTKQQDRRDVRDRAGHRPDGRGADQERQREAPEQIEHVGYGERRGHLDELDHLRHVGAVQVGQEEGADAQGEAVEDRREPGQIEPRPRHCHRAVQPEDRRHRERQDRLKPIERRAADEDADRQGQRDSPRRIVEPQHSAEPRAERAAKPAQGRGRHLPTPSSTATIASTHAAWTRISTASRGVASFKRIAERPSVEARKKIRSTLCLRVKPSCSNRW